VAGMRGFEPLRTAPEAAVLPLDGIQFGELQITHKELLYQYA
jgi:hypothetical protein